MSLLNKYDFNKLSGWLSIVFISIAISLTVFAGVYLFESLDWLSAAKEEPSSSMANIGNNWIRGAVISAGVALLLFVSSVVMLSQNKKAAMRRGALFKHLDLNSGKGVLGLVFLSVSFTFFLNAGLYRIEVIKWFSAALATAQEWYFQESASWLAASTTMALIGIGLSAAGWLMIVLTWKRR